MARDRQHRARNRLLREAAALVGVENVAVLIVRRLLDVVTAEESAPAQTAEELSRYDAAILTACTDKPLSAERIARLAGHRYNSYYRERLARLVEQGRIVRTRRGYRLPPGK